MSPAVVWREIVGSTGLGAAGAANVALAGLTTALFTSLARGLGSPLASLVGRAAWLLPQPTSVGIAKRMSAVTRRVNRIGRIACALPCAALELCGRRIIRG